MNTKIKDITAAEIELLKKRGKVRDGKAIVSTSKIQHAGKAAEMKLVLEDGTEIFEDEGGKPLTKFTEATKSEAVE